jgi:single-stranded DNA-binding protein
MSQKIKQKRKNMSLAKSVVTGIVHRAPEKRFTQNNIAVSAFVLNIGDREETLIRVVSRRNALDETVSSLSKGEKLLVEGRLQTATAKMDDGTEKRIYEIDASTIEKMGATGSVSNSDFGTEEIVKFESDDMSNQLINEDEIPF